MPEPARRDEPMIELNDIQLSFGRNVILDRISLKVFKNEVVAVLGPSGGGKSTLIKIVAGLLIPDGGEVLVRSERVGLAFQEGALFTSVTVAENLEMVLQRTTDLSEEAIQKKIQDTLQVVGLETELHKMPSELSGGMQKRVGIARALCIDPEVMLYDEPSAGLDPILAAKLERDLRQINQERQMATLLVTHELPTIDTMADRVVLLYNGKIVFEGSKDDFFSTREPHAYQFRTRREAGPIEV